MLISSYFLCRNLQEDNKQEEIFEEIKVIAEDNNDDNNKEIKNNNINMQKLHEINNDIVGWIQIDNSNIDYPVMQTKESPNYYLRKNFYKPYKILMVLYIFMILFAFIVNTPTEILSGLHKILFTPDILITDYIQVGGIGAGIINSALTSLLCMLLLMFTGIVPNGSTIMALWLVTGFAFLGKNILYFQLT